MALFSRTKKTSAKADKKTGEKTAEKTVSTKPVVSNSFPTDRDLAGVIVKPHVTEKAVGMGERNVHTFIVRPDATKYLVRDAIKSLYNVTPVKINIVNKTPRQFKSKTKGRRLTEKGVKKAYVYLKDGDSINLV
ncbi:MAG: large subunit ribosomal protein L23 [Acidimicrobiales bacterium]|jgi:large subunit ribosomal protein L23